MANTVLKDRQGVDWPLGYVNVSAAGTPVRITVNIDANNTNAPETASNSTTDEFVFPFQQIIFQSYKPAANNNGVIANTGNIYLLRYNANGAGAGNKTDYGVYVTVIAPNQTFVLSAGYAVNDVLNPYRYALDVDNNNEGAIITGLRF